MHFWTCGASSHCFPVLEKGLKVLFKYCKAVGSSSMAAGLSSEPGLSVQAPGYCCRSSFLLAVSELSAAPCLPGAEGLAALLDCSEESSKDISSFVGLRCSDLCIATSSAEAPSAGFLHPSLSTL